MTQQHAKHAASVLDRIAAGETFEDIFPRKESVSPAPSRKAGWIDFLTMPAESPHGGSATQTYLLMCAHGSSQLDLAEPFPSDSEVLGNMLETYWARTGCDCRPIGWGAA